MKTLTLFFLLFILALTSFSQTGSVSKATVNAQKRLIIVGDTIKATTQMSSIDTIAATKQFVLSNSGSGSGWDSLTWSYGNIKWMKGGIKLDSIPIDGRYINVADSMESDNINYVTHMQLNTAVNQSNAQTVYTISLPAAASVAQRCAGASSPNDYPIYWTITEGSNPVDLKITHALGRKIANVTVWLKNGSTLRQLFGNAAYSGIYAETSQILIIESLATVNYPIEIQLIFANE